MRNRLIVVLSMAIFAVPASAKDACSLLQAKQIEQVQQGSFVRTRASVRPAGETVSSTCYFELNPSSKSVSLQVITGAKNSEGAAKLWKNKFHADPDDKEGQESEVGEGRKKQKPPQALKGVGDEAYWVDTGRDGALYALSGETIVRLSLGGNTPQKKKMDDASELAKQVVANLKAASQK